MGETRSQPHLPELASSGDRRIIEDYLPIKAISAEASREKSVRKGHISTLHLWWARRPLVACRAAIYGALVPEARFRPTSGPDERLDSLARANASTFVERLCKYPGDARVIAEAQQHILEAHAERLSRESKSALAVEDILQGRAPRPKVLDMFAGGGAIPLEAMRLGCEAYALDLNPVAYIIELCTLVYPKQYGSADKAKKGSANDGTWAGLAEEVGCWGRWVLQKAKAEVGDLYPLIPDPRFKGDRPASQSLFLDSGGEESVPPGYLAPVAYLWTRTVRCKNPSCGAAVPLVRQTWLCKMKNRYVALKMVAPSKGKRVRFEVAEATSEGQLHFDPAAFSKGGNATCPFCGTVADAGYVRAEGCSGRISQQMMAVVCTRPARQGKIYISSDDLPGFIPEDQAIRKRIEVLCASTGIGEIAEPIEVNPRSMDTQHFGLLTWGSLFTDRQMLSLLTFVVSIRVAETEMRRQGYDADRAKAVTTCLGCVLDKQADFNSSLCVLKPDGGRGIVHTFGRQALPMVWDFAEANPFDKEIACWQSSLKEVVGNINALSTGDCAHVSRGSATNLPWDSESFDAVITDPPYYDNVSYSNLSDFFYVWLKRAIGHLYPDHFATEATPKKAEIIAASYRHGGNKTRSRAAYESMMTQAFGEAFRVLKPGGQMTVVYAHKTALGWATLVDALRRAGFTVMEAWPLDTETSGRLIAHDTASLASSIFLVARKRVAEGAGSYEGEVRPNLERIVRERVEVLWEMGISGADLVIAAVGAGLRAFTRFARVEYANGEEVPAERFLIEVEGVVLETLLEKIFDIPRSGVAAVDAASRFYVLWRYAYKAAELDGGEAIVFTYGQGVELDGPKGLSSGNRAIVSKEKGRYRLRDYTERGADDRLGMPTEDGSPAPLIDALHRILWLVEHKPRSLTKFLDEARPDRERLRLVVQALAGAGLKGKSGEETKGLISTTPPEQAALGKLLANWRTLIESPVMPLYDSKSEG